MLISDYTKEPKFLQTVETFETWLREALGDEIENVPDFYQWALYTAYCDQDIQRLTQILFEYVREFFSRQNEEHLFVNDEK